MDDKNVVKKCQKKSPLANTGKVAVPLLIIAGAQDKLIPIADIKNYALKLSTQNKPVALWIDESAGHNVDKDNTLWWESYLALIDAALEKALHKKANGYPEKLSNKKYLKNRVVIDNWIYHH